MLVDELGSYDPDETSSPYYLACLVFHDQDADISGEILKLEEDIAATGRDASHCIHTAPLIRHEPDVRMVEIEVYSTVGTSRNVDDIPRSFGVICGNEVVGVYGKMRSVD